MTDDMRTFIAPNGGGEDDPAVALTLTSTDGLVMQVWQGEACAMVVIDSSEVRRMRIWLGERLGPLPRGEKEVEDIDYALTWGLIAPNGRQVIK